MNNITRVFIAASGKGDRMFDYYPNLPKPLYPYKGYPIIGYLIDTYLEYTDQIIVSHSTDSKGILLKNWLLDYYKDPSWLYLVEQVVQNGTGVLLKDNIPVGSDVLVSWADFVFVDNSGLDLIDKDKVTFGISDIDCRWSIHNGKIKHKNSSKDGLLGLYYFPSFPRLNNTRELLENFKNKVVDTVSVNVVDLGTREKYFESGADVKRLSLNSIIEIKKDVIIKTETSRTVGTLKGEHEWYWGMPQSLNEYLPRSSYENGRLVLQKFEGKHGIDNTDSYFWKVMIREFLSRLHEKKFPVRKSEVFEIYFSKPFKRLLNSERVLSYLGDIDYKLLESLQTSFKEIGYPEHFTYFHGDLTISNMIIVDKGLKVIDPKGALVGDPRYDIAKIFYSMGGFEQIKNNDFSLLDTDGSWVLDIKDIDRRDILDFKEWVLQEYNITERCMKLMLISIWMSATGFFLYDPRMCFAFYLQALNIIKGLDDV